MGTVYRALQLPIQREVAVKVLRRAATDDPRAVRRFFKEARSIAQLHHPHIISLYDFGQSEETGDLYLVMELLPGQSLAELLRREKRLSLSRAVGILDQVLDALQEAHSTEIVHRDLKPDNIQIGRRGDRDDFVVVLDFGIARHTDIDGTSRPDTTTIEVCGTPAYMSPEQILGSAVDPRSDLYACGVLLFEMVSGMVPFDSENTIDVYMAHLKQPVPRLKDCGVPDGGPPGLQELIDRVLAKAAEDRIPDARSFRHMLRSIAGTPSGRQRKSTGRGGNVPVGVVSGYELVATLTPENGKGADELLKQWALDIGQFGGSVRERTGGTMVAVFPDAEDAGPPIRAALTMKQRTRARRLKTLRPLYMRAGIHDQPTLAARLCEEAPRGGVVLAADCVEKKLVRDFRGRIRLEPAGELRVRGHKGPVEMIQVITGR